MASNEDKPPSENQDEESTGASGGSKQSEDESTMDYLQRVLDSLKVFNAPSEAEKAPEQEKEKPEQLLDEVSFNGVANYIKNNRCSKIIVMTGAGISTAAGIPDFRSPGTGLYDNLQKYDLPYPQAVFEINFFRENPEPFCILAKELYPGKFLPTISHYFIKTLSDKGLLLRNYTQNIDTLERVAGIPHEKLIEAHGSFHTAHCLECRKEYSHEWIREEVFADRIPICSECKGVVKPDIVFFGESLPERFHQCVKQSTEFQCNQQDTSECDLLIVMGTSLKVQPFASLVDRVPETTPRLLINKEKCGQEMDFFSLLMGGRSGFQFDSEENYRDVMWQGTTDDGCVALADLLGWKDELLKLVQTEHKKLGSNTAKASESKDVTDNSASKRSVNKDKEKIKTTPPKSPSPKSTPAKSTPTKSSSSKKAQSESSSPKSPSSKSPTSKSPSSKSPSSKSPSQKSPSQKSTSTKSTSSKGTAPMDPNKGTK